MKLPATEKSPVPSSLLVKDDCFRMRKGQSQKGEVAIGAISPTGREWVPRVGGGEGREDSEVGPSPGAILGIGSHTVFLLQSTAPSPGGIGRFATGLLAGDTWAAEPGISLQTLTVSFLCSSLPVPTPHLCKSLGTQLSLALERAKALGEEIDRGLPPPKLLCWDPQWLIVPSSGEEAVGGVLVNKSVPGAS